MSQLDPKVHLWARRFKIAEQNQQELFQRFAAWYDLMNAVVREDYAPWRSKVFLPLLAGRAWALIAKLSAGKPVWQVKPRSYSEDEAQQMQSIMAAEANEIMLEYSYDNPEFDEPMRKKLSGPLMDAVVCGTGIAKLPWVSKVKQLKSRVIDPTTGEAILGQEEVKPYRCSYNDMNPHSVFRTFIAPSALTGQSSPWIILQDWTTMADLKATNAAKGGNFYKNLDKLVPQVRTNAQSHVYEQSRNRFLNSTDPISQDETIDSIEIWECYDRLTNTITWVANGTTVLREVQNPYWHGRYPLVFFELKPVAQSFWGQGIFQVNERMQLIANDILAHFLDNLNLALDGMLMHSSATEIEEFNIQPAGEIIYTGTEAPEPYKFPEPNPNGVRMIMDLLQAGIQDNSISPYVSGTPSDQTDKTQGTMGGIMALQQAADDVLSYMRDNYIQSIREMGRQWLSNNLQFQDRAVFVSITKHGAEEIAKITPEAIQGEFDLMIDDSSVAPISKEQERQEWMMWLQQLKDLKMMSEQDAMKSMPQTDPETGMPLPPMGPPVQALGLNYVAIAEELSQKFGIRGFERFIDMQPQPQIDPMTGMPMDPMMGGDPSMGGMPGMEEELDARDPGLIEKVIGSMRGGV